MKNVQENPGFVHLHRLKTTSETLHPVEWLHMCIRHRETAEFLMDAVQLDDLIVDAMVEEDTRSRIRIRPDGIMVLLKAMHIRECDDGMPEDMISMRLWIAESQIITTREEDVDPITEIHERITAQNGPSRSGEFLADIIELHLDELNPFIEGLEDTINTLDDMIARHEQEALCNRLANLQLQTSGFLRHLTPQRDVLETLAHSRHALIHERDRERFAEALNLLLRFLETLQNVRERSEIINDQIARIQDRQLNQTSYVFAIAATIFLPLGFVTGLFGVNLQGIFIEQHSHGFLILLMVCFGIGAALIGIFRWRKWL